MKLRFSLRALMILMTCAAVLCWWRDRPRRMAEQFVEAIDAGRFGVADALFTNPDDQSCVQFMESDSRNRIRAHREAQTPSEWLKGDCRVLVSAHDFRGLGGETVVIMVATPHGMQYGPLIERGRPVQFDDPKRSAEVQRVR